MGFGLGNLMFGFKRKRSSRQLVDALHARVVEASRRPSLYGPGGFRDTVEGRFEALSLHAMLVLRRLRALPPPAGDVAQDLVDALFAHLEVALRETGIGDFGVPKRMKKLAQAFYDRTAKYDPCLEDRDPDRLADEIATRLGGKRDEFLGAARDILACQARLAGANLDAILAGDPLEGSPGREQVREVTP